MTARALMILGTASHVGKSIITAGLGRIFADAGIRVAPFKAQNMSLNSAATPNGGEIGRAQALQAEACRIAARVEMNPVLIKPRSDSTSQVVLLGKVWGQVSARDYHTRRVEQLFPVVLESYRKLAAQYELILLEGAGSPAEINLREHDIVNLRMARAAGAACLLGGDIDRGGVFASLLGTMELLEDDERKMIKGFVINKFRGDKTLLQPGIDMIGQRLGLPCVGVVPHLHDLNLDEEDSIAMQEHSTPLQTWKLSLDDHTLEYGSPNRKLRIGVIAFPHLSNFTDFDALTAEPSVALAFLHDPAEIALADALILPGTKQTLDDWDWLSSRGFVQQILEHRAKKKLIVGICGGFQMLGSNIFDPSGIENDGKPTEREGLKIVSMKTILETKKTVQRITGTISSNVCSETSWINRNFTGYEIHVGETYRNADVQPFATIVRASGAAKIQDGAVSPDGLAFGTYVHGIFDDDLFRHSFVNFARALADLAPARQHAHVTSEREVRLDRLASHLKNSLDLVAIRAFAGLSIAPLSLES